MATFLERVQAARAAVKERKPDLYDLAMAPYIEAAELAVDGARVASPDFRAVFGAVRLLPEATPERINEIKRQNPDHWDVRELYPRVVRNSPTSKVKEVELRWEASLSLVRLLGRLDQLSVTISAWVPESLQGPDEPWSVKGGSVLIKGAGDRPNWQGRLEFSSPEELFSSLQGCLAEFVAEDRPDAGPSLPRP